MVALDDYLRRIGHDGPRKPTLQTLSAMCALQPAHLSFENFDAFLGTAPRLDEASLHAKLVAQTGRGGYCYELNGLLRLALVALGFRVTALAARVVWMAPPGAPLRPPSHMLLCVHLPEGDYLADAGFGGHLLGAPLRLAPGAEQHGVQATLRVTHDDGNFSVETQLPVGWTPLYRFTLEPRLPIDYEPLNWFTATHPSSLFPHNLLLERLAPNHRASLLNDRLTVRRADGTSQSTRLSSAMELGDAIADLFQLRPPRPVAELFERMARGLDGPKRPETA